MRIAQLLPGIDNTVLFIIFVLAAIIIPAALLLKRSLRERSADEGSRKQRPDTRPSEKTMPVAPWVPGVRPVRKQQSVTTTVPDVELLKNCQDLQQSLNVLAGKYSLDSFTIATSDGLVFASSGSETARVDAARYSRQSAGNSPAGMTLIGLKHKGSELTGIIRSSGSISPEIQKHIEHDSKDILNWWI